MWEEVLKLGPMSKMASPSSFCRDFDSGKTFSDFFYSPFSGEEDLIFNSSYASNEDLLKILFKFDSNSSFILNFQPSSGPAQLEPRLYFSHLTKSQGTTLPGVSRAAIYNIASPLGFYPRGLGLYLSIEAPPLIGLDSALLELGPSHKTLTKTFGTSLSGVPRAAISLIAPLLGFSPRVWASFIQLRPSSR